MERRGHISRKIPSQESILSGPPPLHMDYDWWFESQTTSNGVSKREFLESLFDGNKIDTFFDGIVFLLRFLLFILVLTKACLILTLLIQGRLLVSTSDYYSRVSKEHFLASSLPSASSSSATDPSSLSSLWGPRNQQESPSHQSKLEVISENKEKDDEENDKREFDYVTGMLLPMGYMALTLLFACLIPIPETSCKTHLILVITITVSSVYEVIANHYSPLSTRNVLQSISQTSSSGNLIPIESHTTIERSIIISPALDLPSFSLAVFSMCYLVSLLTSHILKCSSLLFYSDNPSTRDINLENQPVIV